MAELLGELDDGRALLADQQRGECVAQVVRARAAEAGRRGGGVEVAVAPVVPVVRPPRRTVEAREDQRACGWRARRRSPRGEVLGKRLEQIDGAVDAVGLLALEAAIVDGLLNQERALADVAPFEAKCLAWA